MSPSTQFKQRYPDSVFLEFFDEIPITIFEAYHRKRTAEPQAKIPCIMRFYKRCRMLAEQGKLAHLEVDAKKQKRGAGHRGSIAHIYSRP